MTLSAGLIVILPMMMSLWVLGVVFGSDGCECVSVSYQYG
jgi:uncharacterized membrane protein